MKLAAFFVLHGKKGLSALQNRPFHEAKQALSDTQTGLFATPHLFF